MGPLAISIPNRRASSTMITEITTPFTPSASRRPSTIE